ncbi:MAG: exopolysaccharide biosynthesis polyprenyl glycosylphosphotransferase, partial [Hyphomonadaceae bacterium]
SLRIVARLIDVIALYTVTLSLAYSAGLDVWGLPVLMALPLFLLPPTVVASIWMAGGFRFRYAEAVAEHLLRAVAGAAIGLCLTVLFAFLIAFPLPSLLINICAVNALAILSLHANYLGVIRAATRKGLLSDNVVIVGATQAAARIVSRNVRERELNIVGYFDDRANRTVATMMGDTPHLGAVDDLLTWERLPEIDRIVVTVTSTAQARVRELIDRIRNLPHEIILVLDLDGFNPEHTSLARVVDAPAAYISGAPKDVRRATVKRAFDLAFACAAAIVLAIPMLVIGLLIRLDSKGPILFRQKRHGFNNEVFSVWKFRTMRSDKAAEQGIIQQTVANDPRVTRIGRFLRLSSLDELPQILNVLKGEMSIVGPRPHAVGMTAGSIEVTRTVGDYAHRHRMKPGMTGWAQVNGSRGPCHTPDEVRERVRLDMEYVNRASVWLDLWIVLKTIPCLLGDRERSR